MTAQKNLETMIDPKKTQVFLLTCPAHFPFRFAVHPWFVINRNGTLSRWEVVVSATCEHTEDRFGHIHRNALPPFSGISFFSGWDRFFSQATLLGSIDGDTAEKIATYIEASKTDYRLKDTYSLFGSNSNTYAQWILNAFPEWKIALPKNAFGKDFKPIQTGVIHGRFQPPHNGHIRYILSALGQAERLIIGICSPKLCTKEEAARTGYPCTAELNPFTHDERAEMLALALDEAGVSRNTYSFVAFPSDYTHLETILPKDSVFLMSVTGETDYEKIAYIESLGYKTQTIVSLPSAATRDRSGAVRFAAQNNDSAWENMVPESTARYMKEHGLIERL